MKGMILKDFINIKTQLVYYAAAALVFGAVSVVMNNIYFFCGFMLFISLGSLMSAMAYDEQDRWAKFAVASGVPRRKLVGEKYLLSLFLTIPVMLLGLVVVCLLAEQGRRGYTPF
ncbi:MAG: ABC-2 transporter permease [Eubacteriales bacterium]